MKRTIIGSAIVLVVFAGGAIWYLNNRQQPQILEELPYKGEPVSHWIDQFRKTRQEASVLAAASAVGQGQAVAASTVLVAQKAILQKAYTDLGQMVGMHRGRIPKAEIVAEAVRGLEGPGRPVRGALYVIGQVALRDSKAAAPTFSALKRLILDRDGQDVELRSHATFVVGLYADRVPEAVSFLLDLLHNDPDGHTRHFAVQGLAHANQPKIVMPELIKAMRDPHHLVRSSAALGMSTCGGEVTPEGVAMLRKLADDPNENEVVRSCADSSLYVLKLDR